MNLKLNVDNQIQHKMPQLYKPPYGHLNNWESIVGPQSLIRKILGSCEEYT